MIGGWCREEFGAVRETFAANFSEQGEVGAAVCVIVDGAVVVDLVGGWADQLHRRPWQPSTMVDFY
jgi:CubicO group peptidase (beta-lactamase class C family)